MNVPTYLVAQNVHGPPKITSLFFYRKMVTNVNYFEGKKNCQNVFAMCLWSILRDQKEKIQKVSVTTIVFPFSPPPPSSHAHVTTPPANKLTSLHHWLQLAAKNKLFPQLKNQSLDHLLKTCLVFWFCRESEKDLMQNGVDYCLKQKGEVKVDPDLGIFNISSV